MLRRHSAIEFAAFADMTANSIHVALIGVLVCAQLSAGRIISFHSPTTLPAPKLVGDASAFRIVIADQGAPHFAALTGAASEPAPVREEQLDDVPPPPPPRPQVRPLPPSAVAAQQQMVNPPAFAADVAAAFGFAAAPGLPAPGPGAVTNLAAPQPALAARQPAPPQGVVQLVNSIVPNAGARIVEPPPAIVPPPDAVNYVPLREQAQQLLAQGYDLSPYRAAPGAALAASAPRLTAPEAASYASNFDAFSSGIGAAPAAPLVAASPLSRQAASLFSADPASQLITHHPGHGANGATSFSSSSFSNTVQ